jgi:hypothetical protein
MGVLLEVRVFCSPSANDCILWTLCHVYRYLTSHFLEDSFCKATAEAFRVARRGWSESPSTLMTVNNAANCGQIHTNVWKFFWLWESTSYYLKSISVFIRFLFEVASEKYMKKTVELSHPQPWLIPCGYIHCHMGQKSQWTFQNYPEYNYRECY